MRYDNHMTTTNDTCTVHDLDRDVHDAVPTDCPACVPHRGGPVGCLSHTCPDCGSITHSLLNDRNELIHDCPTRDLDAGELAEASYDDEDDRAFESARDR